jgi:hypothetical protein
MRRTGWTPSIVPNGHDQTFYLVINNYGKSGAAFAETDWSMTKPSSVLTGKELFERSEKGGYFPICGSSLIARRKMSISCVPVSASLSGGQKSGDVLRCLNSALAQPSPSSIVVNRNSIVLRSSAVRMTA